MEDRRWKIAARNPESSHHSLCWDWEIAARNPESSHHCMHIFIDRRQRFYKFPPLSQKNPRAHKIKSALPPPQTQNTPPPLKRGSLWTWRFSCTRKAIFPGAHKIGAAISGPRIADTTFTDMRIFLIICFSRTKNQPKEEVFRTDIPRTSGGHSRGHPGPKLRSGRSKLWKNKHMGADIHDPKARTSTTLRDFQKLRSKKLRAEFSFPSFGRSQPETGCCRRFLRWEIARWEMRWPRLQCPKKLDFFTGEGNTRAPSQRAPRGNENSTKLLKFK